MLKPNTYKQEIYWLLKEKYGYTGSQLYDQEIDINPQIQDDINRIQTGEPLAYVIGFTTFITCQIDLSLRPLIPRPETEFWVKRVINQYMDLSIPINVLDMCCGSGCIGLSILKHIPLSNVDFVDIDDRALSQTKINLEKNNIDHNRYSLIRSNLFTRLATKRYHLILVNPPYLPTNSQTFELSFEPPSALYSGTDGLGIIKKIIREFSHHLYPAGQLFLEFDSPQKTAIEEFCSKNRTQAEFYFDQFGQLRYLRLTHP